MFTPHREFSDERIPFGYLITFRSFGTWLHGDARGSVDRHHNRYGSPKIPANEKWRNHGQLLMKQPPVRLNASQRSAVEEAIRETCRIRKWLLWTINVRTNHVHTVVTANRKPGPILNAFKANATRQMRETGCWHSKNSPWADRGSKKYLWTERDLTNAIEYVEHDQGESLD